jgi:hypothetical protein
MIGGTIDVVYEYPEGGEKLTHIVGRDGKTACGFEGEQTRQPADWASVWCTACLQGGWAS